MFVLRDVTHSDQGLYAIKLSSGFTYETVRLNVFDCIRSYQRNYGENFEHDIPPNGSLLEFFPRGALPQATPVLLWNRTDPDSSETGRGRLLRGGKVWVAERVTQADQGNYTMRDSERKVLSRSTLTVRGHTFNVTRFTKESLNLPLFLPVPHAHLIFTPTRHPDDASLDPFDAKPPRGPVHLIREGQIMDYDVRYRGLISLGRNGTVNEVVIARLTSKHDGLYEIRDMNGNLVSSTSLQVIGRWRALLKSITVPSGLFVSLAGFILFMKHYPNCSIPHILSGFRANRIPPANLLRVNIQDYSQPSPQYSDYYGHCQQPGTPRTWSPRASPAHTGYTPVVIGPSPRLSPIHIRAENQEPHRLGAGSSARYSSSAKDECGERKLSFSVPGASDCLHSSTDCVQFQIKSDGDQEKWNQEQDYFSTLPLDTDTSESWSVYTSDKLNIIGQ
ncbi:uncharacterized protein LOC117520252 isoform X2 [Thalassophryne amazonica]|uniref:uncharacterized protein LOC117520252 isoform X2 n=1 Tax=Thalassophryne amazonica TaxID=390379 RepID=UPI001471BB21|nr:uncharacterized protein LOC117520252 isoform X2 [Thalassophryne amazonica]